VALEDIVIPQVGEAVDEVSLLEWYKEVGDPVSEGDVLFDVDTDKAIVEIPAFADGILTEIICGNDSLAMPLQVVGRLETSRPSPEQTEVVESPDTEVAAEQSPTPESRVEPRSSRSRSDRASVSPRALRVAEELGVDLATISGSGVDGIITEKDVRNASPTENDASTSVEKTRKAVGRRTAASKSTVPHFYVEMDVDFSAVEELRAATDSEGRSPTITAVIVHACASALALEPNANVTFRDDELERRSTIAVGVSVATERGLTNITLPDLEGVEINEISERLGAAAGRARDFQLQPSDLAPKGLVVSNLGMYGVDAFTAIIDMPDSMILAVGRVVPRPVVENDQVVVRPIARLTISADHRAIDGEGAAIFLGHVRRILEEGSHA